MLLPNNALILVAGKKISAAEAARAASQTLQMRLFLQDRLQIGKGRF